MGRILDILLIAALLYWFFFMRSKNIGFTKTTKSSPKPTVRPSPLKMATCTHCNLHLPLNEAYVFDGRHYCSLEHYQAIDKKGWVGFAIHKASPNFDARPQDCQVDTVVIHHISLPEGRFGGNHIEEFFLNQLDPKADPYFETIQHLQVSAHFLIKRNGSITQFVSTEDRAWHAGASQLFDRGRCNDFSIGIELEGTGDIAFEESQYQTLAKLIQEIEKSYSIRYFVGHSDISPQRKTDPGISFDWKYVTQLANIPSEKLPFGTLSR